MPPPLRYATVASDNSSDGFPVVSTPPSSSERECGEEMKGAGISQGSCQHAAQQEATLRSQIKNLATLLRSSKAPGANSAYSEKFIDRMYLQLGELSKAERCQQCSASPVSNAETSNALSADSFRRTEHSRKHGPFVIVTRNEDEQVEPGGNQRVLIAESYDQNEKRNINKGAWRVGRRVDALDAGFDESQKPDSRMDVPEMQEEINRGKWIRSSSNANKHNRSYKNLNSELPRSYGSASPQKTLPGETPELPTFEQVRDQLRSFQISDTADELPHDEDQEELAGDSSCSVETAYTDSLTAPMCSWCGSYWSLVHDDNSLVCNLCGIATETMTGPNKQANSEPEQQINSLRSPSASDAGLVREDCKFSEKTVKAFDVTSSTKDVTIKSAPRTTDQDEELNNFRASRPCEPWATIAEKTGRTRHECKERSKTIEVEHALSKLTKKQKKKLAEQNVNTINEPEQTSFVHAKKKHNKHERQALRRQRNKQKFNLGKKSALANSVIDRPARPTSSGNDIWNDPFHTPNCPVGCCHEADRAGNGDVLENMGASVEVGDVGAGGWGVGDNCAEGWGDADATEELSDTWGASNSPRDTAEPAWDTDPLVYVAEDFRSGDYTSPEPAAPGLKPYTVTYWATVECDGQKAHIPIDSSNVSGSEKTILDGPAKTVWNWAQEKGLGDKISLQDAFDLAKDMAVGEEGNEGPQQEEPAGNPSYCSLPRSSPAPARWSMPSPQSLQPSGRRASPTPAPSLQDVRGGLFTDFENTGGSNGYVPFQPVEPPGCAEW